MSEQLEAYSEAVKNLGLGKHEHMVHLVEGPLAARITAEGLHYQPGIVFLNRFKYLSEETFALPRPNLIDTRAKIRERYGADCGAGHDAGIRQIREHTELGTRTWYECVECGITVKPPCCGGDNA